MPATGQDDEREQQEEQTHDHTMTQLTIRPRNRKPRKIHRCGMAVVCRAAPGLAKSYLVTSSSGMADSRSGAPSVTMTVSPRDMASWASLSIRIMCRKNTMPGAASTGLP